MKRSLNHAGRAGLLAILLALAGILPARGLAAPAGADCVSTMAGDLMEEIEELLESERLPGPGSNGMVVPSTAQMEAWQEIVAALARDDPASACDAIAAHALPYHVLHYDDTSRGHKYWILREDDPVSVGWGTVVVRDGRAARDVTIEVPHPGYEVHAHEEAVALLWALDARALVLAGTDRCANTSYAACGGTTTVCSDTEELFRSSDVGHSTRTMFQAAHEALVARRTAAIAIQLHGHAEAACSDLIISNGTYTPGPLVTHLYQQAVAACPSFSIDLADGEPGQCPLAGSNNVQGRHLNGCPGVPDYQPCSDCARPPAPPSPEQFIHLEQSHRLRDEFGCLLSALSATLSVRSYAPNVVRQFAPYPPKLVPAAGGTPVTDLVRRVLARHVAVEVLRRLIRR